MNSTTQGNDQHTTVKVKICGLTNLPDALEAVSSGADFLGFVFHPGSKRFVTKEVVQAITAEIRSLPRPPVLVGVFVDDSVEDVAAALDFCALDLAQLHGNEPPSFIGDRSSPLFERGYKALKPSSLAEAQVEAEWYVAPSQPDGWPTLLIDTYHPSLPGGTGKVADWSMAQQLAAANPHLMLAGGLTPANVGSAVKQVRPFAVDVSSGVESSPGKKAPELIHQFIRAAKTNRENQYENSK